MSRESSSQEWQQLKESEKHYRSLLDESSDPIFSFYPDGTYRYANQAFAKGVGQPVEKIIGFRIWDVFEKEEADKRFAVVKEVFATGRIKEFEVRVPLPSGDTYYLTTAKPVLGEDGAVDSVICGSKNITQRKLAEIKLQEEHDKLLKALEEIKTLSGLLPICSSCKKIRDDKGYWNLIETYIETHSQASFSHGLCPECSERMYSGQDWYDDMKKKKKT